MSGLPDPTHRPLLTVDELIDLVPTLGRTSTYEAMRRGEIPSISIGRKRLIPVAALRRAWGIDPPLSQSADDARPLRAV